MSDEGERTCPLCAEEMDLTDQQLKPCRCGYEICVWCWHHVMDMAEKDDTEGRCPACRSPYDKEKIVGMAANCERMVTEMNMERKKSQKAKTKTTEGRKQLSSVRVIQRNLVYIVGLPLNLADEDLLQRREYFGQYGKVLKVSMSRTAAGVIQQFPNNTCSVYITYSKEEDAIRCIQSVHGFILDGRPLKACFGTTKYCHAWLRNVPCTNPDCLYLHEIGSQEDSFTKDEIISAYTRSRVQQIMGATNNMLRRAGSMLPPPLDDYCNNNSASAPKPIVKSASTNATSTGKGSPPNGSSNKTGGLPAAASWGMRSSSQPQVASSAYSNGPTKPKPETVDSIPLSSALANTTQISTVHSDIGKKAIWIEESQHINGKVKPDILNPAKLNSGTDFRPTIQDRPVTSDATPATLSDQPPISLEPPKHEWSKTMTSDITNSNVHSKLSSDFEKEVAFEGNIGDLCSDTSSTKVNGDCESESFRPSSSHSDHCTVKSPRSHGPPYKFAEQYGEIQGEKTSVFVNGVCAPREKLDWKSEPDNQAIGNTVSEIEDDVISFANQRLKDPEVVSHNSYLPSSASSFHIPNHSRSHSFQQNEPFGAVSLNPDSLFVDSRVVDRPHLHASSNSVILNGYPDTLVSSHSSSVSNMENSYLISNEGERKHMGRLQVDTGNATMDGGENSIISNILSLDLDSWDDPLTSPQHLAKLLGDSDKKSSALKMSGSWKVQSNNQSRFSFARQEESRNQPFGVDSSFNAFGQLPRQQSFSQDVLESRNSLLDKLGIGNGISSSGFGEPESFACNPLFSSNKPAVSRAQFSAPPGFSVPSRAPPPGFSSYEKMDQTYDTVSGNHLLDSSSLLRNSYLTAQSGNNISNTGDIEFMDPAILAVGKGNNISRLQSGLNSPGLDMRSNFQQQFNAFENEARLQLLMQRSLSSRQNMRYPDIGDNFSSINDSYGISSRLMDQSQVNNLSPFAQLSLQQPRNGIVSNGHWDSWSEVQGGNSLGVAELLRNERLGFNKFYGAGYEDSKFRVPNSGSLYNRTFEM